MVSRAAQAALAIYQQTSPRDRVRQVYQDLYEYYLSNFGEVDGRTIDSLYSLASFSMEEQNTNHAAQYYSSIARSVRQSGSQSDIPALEALCRIYLSEQSWAKAEVVFQYLWKIFVDKGKDYGISPARTKSLYFEYTHFLEYRTEAGPVDVCKVTEEYRSGCIQREQPSSY